MLPMGFASGIPLALTGGTLQAWLAVDGVAIETIGLFSLIGLPYTVKFLWAPVMDRFAPAWPGRRRGWILLIQVVLIPGILAMAFTVPGNSPLFMAMLAMIVAFLSASQDIVIDAYRADVLKARERGLGAALSVTGYRAAMLVSGALALILADRIGWQYTYCLMAGLIVLCAASTLAGPEPEPAASLPRDMAEAAVGPIREFLSRPAAPAFLALVVLYKLGDAFAGTLTTAFLITGLGFSPTDVGAINKALGLLATVGGALLGGTLMSRLGLFPALMLFGGLQAVSNLSFMALSVIGKSYAAAITAVGLENISGGMGTAAFVALLMALCDRRFTATQYALLSALAALGRVFVGPPAGFLAAWAGWSHFFLFTAMAAAPGLVLLWWLRRPVAALSERSP